MAKGKKEASGFETGVYTLSSRPRAHRTPNPPLDQLPRGGHAIHAQQEREQRNRDASYAIPLRAAEA